MAIVQLRNRPLGWAVRASRAAARAVAASRADLSPSASSLSALRSPFSGGPFLCCCRFLSLPRTVLAAFYALLCLAESPDSTPGAVACPAGLKSVAPEIFVLSRYGLWLLSLTSTLMLLVWLQPLLSLLFLPLRRAGVHFGDLLRDWLL